MGTWRGKTEPSETTLGGFVMSPLFWQVIGVALVMWVIYDLFAGYIWLHRKVMRASEPLFYWSGIALWSLIALYTLGLIP